MPPVLELLRRDLLAQLGLLALATAVACGDKEAVPADDDEGKWTLGGDDTGEPNSSWQTCKETPELTEEAVLSGEVYERSYWLVCGELDADGGCQSAEEVSASALLYGVSDPPDPDFCGWGGDVRCGPEASITDRCCYVMEASIWCEGRPFVVQGMARTAEPGNRDDWASEVAVALDALEGADRAAITRRWLRAAADEHASIAAFARFSLELMAMGAPPELLAGASRAMQDELVHARLCYGVASRLSGRMVGPGVLPMEGAQLGGVDPEALLRATLREGAMGESMAAAEAHEAGRLTADPALKEVLARIAQDETRHAALAWRTVVWLLAEHPELRGVVTEELERGPSLPEGQDEAAPEVLRAGGRLPEADRRRLARQTWEQVVVPVACQVLGVDVRVEISA